MYSALFLIIGFILLYFGGELLVKGSINIALGANISRLVVGMTVVSFATSSPELFVSIAAIFNNSSDIVFGNVIGSNIANIALVLGVTTLIFSINISDKTLKIDFPFLLFSTFFVGIVLFFFESVSFYSGFVFLLILSVFLYYIVKKSRNEINQEDNNQELLKTSMVLNFGYVAIAIVMLKFGADFLVDGAVEIANYFNVEERIIALTVVAIGTSVPELATSIVAALKKEVDLAVGNIVGSNIFNLLVVLGITALFKNINLENINILNVDYLFMLILTLIFGIMIYNFGRGKLNKLKGGLLLLIYVGYLIYTIY